MGFTEFERVWLGVMGFDWACTGFFFTGFWMLSSLNDGCYRVAEEKERGNGLFIRVIERRPVRLRGSPRRLLRSAVLFSSSSSSSFFFLSVSGSVFFVFSLLASLACSLFDLIFWFLLAVAVVCCDGVWLPSCDLWRRCRLALFFVSFHFFLRRLRYPTTCLLSPLGKSGEIISTPMRSSMWMIGQPTLWRRGARPKPFRKPSKVFSFPCFSTRYYMIWFGFHALYWVLPSFT